MSNFASTGSTSPSTGSTSPSTGSTHSTGPSVGSSASNISSMLSKFNSDGQYQAITNMQEMIELFENNEISSFDKMRIFYETADKLVIADLPLLEIKRKIRFITAVCYDVLNGKYADLLNNILRDKKKISEHPECSVGEMTGFSEFYELLSVVILEMAMYNVDNNNHVFNFHNIETVLTMVDVINDKHNYFVSEIKAPHNYFVTN